MEAFSLLKYWRTTTTATIDSTAANARAATKTIVTTYSSDDGEDGPYFDLEFSLPDELKAQNKESEDESDEEESSDSEDENEEGELKFEVTNNECADENHVTLSPSDGLFFKGNLVSIEPSNGSEENSKFPVNLRRSATKFRVLMLKLKKSKSGNGVNLEKAEKSEVDGLSEKKQGKVSSGNKFFTVKFKVEEVPIVSLFTRDNSSKEGKGIKEDNSDTNAVSDERKLAKETVQKYLKMVKPFYVRVSKRYVEKLKFSGGHLGPRGGDGGGGGAAPPSAAVEKGEAPQGNVKAHMKQGNNNLQAGLKVVRKHLGKSRSASAAVSAAPPAKMATSNRRNDSLLQLQDGIQGAIMHCKKSFNASRDAESSSSTLSRSMKPKV